MSPDIAFMIAIDTNILIYAHRPAAPEFERAVTAVTRLADSGQPFALPWPVIHEFLGTVTSQRKLAQGTPMDVAMATIRDFTELSQCHVIGEGLDHFETLAALIREADIRGPRIHDARIAAICLAHGVRELWTADRDFSRFPRLRTRNPLVG